MPKDGGRTAVAPACAHGRRYRGRGASGQAAGVVAICGRARRFCAITTFSPPQSVAGTPLNLRAVTIDGAPWFVAADVCAVLGYVHSYGALNKHVDDEDRRPFDLAAALRSDVPPRIGRPPVGDASAVSAWREATGASIAATAKHWGLATATVKRYCRKAEPGTAPIRMGNGSPGNLARVSLVNESGLYALIMGSEKPQAKSFKKWVTSVVLPAIRKDGGYIKGEEKVATGEMSEDELLARSPS